jgi:dihydrofolate synthase / folylpolyglutamate synthase
LTYEDALNFIHGANGFSVKVGLENIITLLSFMGNPHEGQKYIHIAGTNGKGSTASFVNNILICAGYKTGLFTSPYLERFNERYQINNEPIVDDELSTITLFVQEKIQQMLKEGHPHPTEFEIVTAIGFQFFKNHSTDFVVLEVGLGGRLDATNSICSAIVSIITSIGFDHTKILGNTLNKIAYEKAGILKENGTLVFVPQDPQVDSVILEQAQLKSNHILSVDLNQIQLRPFHNPYQEFDYLGMGPFQIGLLGKHQVFNASLSIETALFLKSKGFSISLTQIKQGLSKTHWPGRFEILSQRPLVIIDAAHNIPSTIALVDTLNTYYKDYKKKFILGFLKDKDIEGILDLLCPISDGIITVMPKNPRGLPSHELKKLIQNKYPTLRVESCDSGDISCYFSKVQEPPPSSQPSLTCVCGSLYLIGDFRRDFKKDFTSQGVDSFA